MLWFIGATIGGAVGWWAGALLGIWGAVMLSAVGTALGVYWANRFVAENF